MSEVTFRLDEDGEHVWYYHRCTETYSFVEDDGTIAIPIGVTPEEQHMLPRGKEKCWTVVQREPLTVVPSIQCGLCSLHGFITNGEWVSC